MNDFIELNGTYYNKDQISSAWEADDGRARFLLKNGRCITAPARNLAQLRPDGPEKILQVIPVAIPISVEHETQSGATWEEDVHYLAVTTSGQLRPLALIDGRYDFADTDDRIQPEEGEN